MSETQIVLLALTSGEHIITEMDYDEHSLAYICNKPMQIFVQSDGPNGQMKVVVSPFMPYADSDSGCAIPLGMAIITLPSESISQAYKNATGSIITPPTPKIILG
jgi:hypothetical protein